ncbi:hypothetical protein EIK77_006545 [Talaromyces pinophilus]|nr:hypothetical protein EIK77_006545 [Talaromyces pinophilus]
MRLFPQFVSTPSTSSSNLPGIELCTLPQPASCTFPKNQTDTILLMKNVNFVWKASPPDRTYITLTLQSSPTGNLVAIVGPVGSGKSTFLKGLAGETPVLQGELFIKYRDLAFCEQTPWLASRTIRDNIIGETSLSEFDAKWYSTVVTACELDLDLKRMPAGHKTLVGSNGAKVSGGQKQRIVRFPRFHYDSSRSGV